MREDFVNNILIFFIDLQEYILPDVKDRQHLLTLHKKAKKIGLDINHYNHLKDEVRNQKY